MIVRKFSNELEGLFAYVRSGEKQRLLCDYPNGEWNAIHVVNIDDIPVPYNKVELEKGITEHGYWVCPIDLDEDGTNTFRIRI